jgi:hypothetical protein
MQSDCSGAPGKERAQMPTPETHASEQLIREILRQIELAGTEAGPLGPPCSAFFLKHYRCSGESEQLIAIWRVTREGVKQLPLQEAERVGPGARRRHLFENGVVELRTDDMRRQAIVRWTLGPLHGHTMRYQIQDDGSLDDGRVTSIS